MVNTVVVKSFKTKELLFRSRIGHQQTNLQMHSQERVIAAVLRALAAKHGAHGRQSCGVSLICSTCQVRCCIIIVIFRPTSICRTSPISDFAHLRNAGMVHSRTTPATSKPPANHEEEEEYGFHEIWGTPIRDVPLSTVQARRLHKLQAPLCRLHIWEEAPHDRNLMTCTGNRSVISKARSAA